MCATRIIHNGLEKAYLEAKHTIMWQDWDTFGLKKTDVHKILAENPGTVYILDLGSGLDMLGYAYQMLGEGVNVVILDNHPPDPEVLSQEEYLKYQSVLQEMREKHSTSFYYESSHQTCTTGIAYNYAKTNGWSVENMEKWAIMGLEGDVAHDPIYNPQGHALFEELVSKHGSVKGLLASKNLNSDYDWSMLGFYAQLFHNPRRMLLNTGPLICYPAMREMEQIPNWLDLYAMVNKEKLDSPILEKGANPATKILLATTLEYRAKKGDVEKRGNYIQLDYPDFAVTIISHKWNIASALASKMAGHNKKTWFVINNMPEYGIHVSGRGNEESPIHIGKVFSKADPAIMEGGGMKPAGSANAHTTNVEAVLDELVRAVRKARYDSIPPLPSEVSKI
jgi:single-stranded DNA-specific DHH superfamily exonuclease